MVRKKKKKSSDDEEIEEEDIKEEVEETADKIVEKQVKIGTLNIHIELTSSDPKDTIDGLIESAENLLVKYGKNIK